MHHLFSSKLVSSSFNVIPISLNGSRKIETNSAEGDVVTSDSLLDIYANRAKYAEIYPDIICLNFVTFATKYKLVNNKLVAQPDNIIPGSFPAYSPNNKGPNFLLYCKYQLLRYKPWHTTQENAWDDEPGLEEIYITKWKDFLQTRYVQQHVPDWCERLHTVQTYSEDDTDFEHTPQELPQREEWMILADLIPGSFVTNNDLDKSLTPLCDWQNDNFKYQDSQIKEMSSWIKKNKDVLNPELTSARQNVDVNTLNDMQKHAYDIIRTHSSQPCPKEPLLVILIGVDGTGKSYLIHAIRNFLQNSCAITATTGKASYNIRGCTIHSLLKLPVGSKGNKE